MKKSLLLVCLLSSLALATTYESAPTQEEIYGAKEANTVSATQKALQDYEKFKEDNPNLTNLPSNEEIKKAALEYENFKAENTSDNDDESIDFLQGDVKLACEAILCLSGGSSLSECKPSLKRYYSITAKKAHKQAKKRANFLKLCPKD
ncbi:MAG: hypothetical protein LUC34_05360 [Campylobacter sp.]|nr:hypothetical protein [Campylobacter sp.]